MTPQIEGEHVPTFWGEFRDQWMPDIDVSVGVVDTHDPGCGWPTDKLATEGDPVLGCRLDRFPHLVGAGDFVERSRIEASDSVRRRGSVLGALELRDLVLAPVDGAEAPARELASAGRPNGCWDVAAQFDSFRPVW